MRGLSLAALLGLALSGLAQPAPAQSLTQQRELQFGQIVVGPTSGAASVAPTGGINCGPHTCLGGHVTGLFRIQGLLLQTYDISFSSGDVLVRTGGGSVPLQNLDDDRGGTVTLNLVGVATFQVGGDIVIDPSTAGGNYDGTYTVFINLQ